MRCLLECREILANAKTAFRYTKLSYPLGLGVESLPSIKASHGERHENKSLIGGPKRRHVKINKFVTENYISAYGESPMKRHRDYLLPEKFRDT
ncbi:hypothetical protein KIN20_002362 [Parelaphostrongylus tenuis]|uniref:Uncharacterized protein n=1 Tax=Parelaphostrongylus tenuis TaxID=148309 RepID=A0AAD5LV29_PARTN|nr:hypothetical protein KIN20_002362 [Parelaphostrongylus tenuis]